MGHTYVEATFHSQFAEGKEVLESLVDTGATFTTIPRNLAQRFKLPHITRRRVTTASGEEQLDVSYVMIEILGEKAITEVLISDKLDRVLIGVLTLEAMGFKVNPTTEELERAELLLL
ncbi:MAG: hypothetical protein DDT30_01730 [Dehalococcoidia bacterium]|nr:hypothetical protein [Bacillota bacterium]MBT9143497.1 hypothetical protein [Bacillota bacterium]